MDVIFNVLKSVGRITTPCVTFKTACVKISVNVITCWRGMIFVFLCAVLKRNARRAILNKLSSTQETPQLLFLKRVCVCVWHGESVSECMDEWSSSLPGWALCFDFFSSSLRSNASPLSYAARTSLEGLQNLSPSTDETPPLVTLPQLLPLPPLPCSSSSWLPVLICWSSPLCLTPLHVWICSAESKAGLHSLSILPTHNVNSLCYSFAYDKAFRHQLHFSPIK